MSTSTRIDEFDTERNLILHDKLQQEPGQRGTIWKVEVI